MRSDTPPSECLIKCRLKELPATDTLPGGDQASIAYALNLVINLSTLPNVAVYDVDLTGNITIGFSNAVKNGQKILLRLKQDATGGRTVTFDASIRLGTSLTSYTATTTASKRDILGFVYDTVANKFDFVGVNKGY